MVIESLPPHEGSEEKQGELPPKPSAITRKKNRIRNLIFTILAGVATFSIIGKPWPEPKSLPKEKITTKSQAHETITHEKDGDSYCRTYDRKGELIFEKHMKNGKMMYQYMFHNGKIFGLYLEEHKKNPDLTPEQYIAFLAKALDSHEKLHVFFNEFWQFTYDSPDPQQPLLKGKDENAGNYVQTPTETLLRIEDGKMLGDCDDVSVLSYHIIRQQEECSPHIISHGNHMYTAWIENREGTYDAFGIAEGGLIKNDMVFSPQEDDGKGTYKTTTEALVALIKDQMRGTEAPFYPTYPPYIIYTKRPMIIDHDLPIVRIVPAQVFHPDYPFPFSYEELLLVGGPIYLLGMQIRRWHNKRKEKKKNVNQT